MITTLTLPLASVVPGNSLPPIVTTTGALGSSDLAVTSTLSALPSLPSVSTGVALTSSTTGAVLSISTPRT